MVPNTEPQNPVNLQGFGGGVGGHFSFSESRPWNGQGERGMSCVCPGGSRLEGAPDRLAVDYPAVLRKRSCHFCGGRAWVVPGPACPATWADWSVVARITSLAKGGFCDKVVFRTRPSRKLETKRAHGRGLAGPRSRGGAVMTNTKVVMTGIPSLKKHRGRCHDQVFLVMSEF